MRLKVSRAGWGHPLMTKQGLDEVNWPGDNLPETLHLKTPFNLKKKKKMKKGKTIFLGQNIVIHQHMFWLVSFLIKDLFFVM